jgi:hypothetical protein
MTEQVTAEEREKLLSKIKKCLALSTSPEPHEAAAAMRQAQKLMEKLGVTAEEVEAPDISEAMVKTREGYGNCRYMNMLTKVIIDAFAVDVVYSRNPGSANRLNVRYFGPKSRVMLAEYTHRVLQRSIEDAWAKYLERRPWMKSVGGKRQAFYLGWLWAVSDKVSAIIPTEVETKATKRFIALRCGELSVFEDRKRTPLDQSAVAEGMAAAEEFNINVPLAEEQLKLEASK